jgi:hypothetical protein
MFLIKKNVEYYKIKCREIDFESWKRIRSGSGSFPAMEIRAGMIV